MENIENNENLEVEEISENVEPTTEESPKLYTEAEFNAKLDEVLGKKIARKEAKIRKEYDRKYGDLTEVLRAGTGKEDVGEITDTFKQFYQKKGIKVPEKPTYTDKDIEVLAKAEADEIIRAGFDDVVEETNRLSDIGLSNMTAREKAVFKALAEYRNSTERGRELSKLGVTEDVYNGDDFKSFASKFAPNTPVRDIYDIYAKTKPKKDIKPMGSMKNSNSADSAIKEYYSPEEARRFTQKEINSNPALVKAIEESMKKWK